MKPSVTQRLDSLARKLTPFALTVVLVLINAVPLPLSGSARVAPVLPLIAVYYWAVYKPDLMPAVAVFVIGVFHDALGGGIMGVNAAVLLAAYGVVSAQARFFVNKTFAVVWLGFVLVAAGAALFSWLLVSVLHFALIDPRALFYQYMLTIGIFPLIAWLLLRWQRAVLA